MPHELREKCAIVGVGETPYVKGTEKSNLSLHLEAACNAIQDCGLSPRDIDGFLPLYASGVHAEQIISNLGIKDLKYSATIHQGGASPLASIESAILAITAGIANCVLLTVGTRGYSDQRASKRGVNAPIVPVFATVNEFEPPYGAVIPVQLYAALARRHMHEYGTTSRQLGAIAVACRKHAMLNPKAIMRTPMTIEDHQNSRMIADPLRKLDCSLESDGAGAVIVTSA
ncbi:MAG: transporter, partial [Dehalococcoidia bacterium]|nr:transporter [Dehalococcoidia bacterium]